MEKELLSAQTLLNGEGFDDKYMIEKAARELGRLKCCTFIFDAYDHIFNLAITIASIADWAFHLRLVDDPKWANKSEIHFANWIRSQSPEAAVFIDIANECKHADRKHRNFLAEKVPLVPFKDPQQFTAADWALFQSKGFQQPMGNGALWIVVPFIVYGGKQDYLYDVAEMAMDWWKAFIPAAAMPMNKDLQPVT